MKHLVGRWAIVFLSLLLTCAAQVSGSGAPGRIPLWTGTTTTTETLGISKLFQTNGKIGVGTTSPAAILDVIGLNATAAGATAQMSFEVKGGTGGPGTSSSRGGAGATLSLAAGTGGGFVLCGSTCRGATGGSGGSITIQGGAGGLYPCCGGPGGSIMLQPGTGGVPGLVRGDILLAPTGGKVGVGEMTPANTLEVASGGTTLADEWTSRSSLRFKNDIRPLLGALEKVEQLRGVSYNRKDDGKHEIGVVAEEVDEILPEIVSREPVTNEVQGVDYSRLTALLIEAVKTEQAEIRQLQARLDALTSKAQQ